MAFNCRNQYSDKRLKVFHTTHEIIGILDHLMPYLNEQQDRTHEGILWVSDMLGHTDRSMRLQMYAKYRKQENRKRAMFLTGMV